ncbi:eukaryotic translation initiation factor 3 subunit 12 [Perkinsela sp. CCAP 1560/4]|nr:eukaryotic translation initiation factor 3 subunit 12 [Perkinsela sp. CCAP 1560/4]|eukprot:KNH09387.1 eukaryotic translation initiation factor 3 subunit 12 [Perkinsela sp. CCAP 1560/4]
MFSVALHVYTVFRQIQFFYKIEMMHSEERSRILRMAKHLEIDAIPEVEKIVRQETGSDIDLDSYVALLKLYQFFPGKANYHTICLIALKSVLLGMRINAFSACWYLIPEKLFEKKELHEIMRLNELLEKMSLEELWSNTASYDGLAVSLGWTGIQVRIFIRQHVLDVILTCHQRIPTNVFLKLMNYSSMEEMKCDPLMESCAFSSDEKMVSFANANEISRGHFEVRAKKLSLPSVPE